MPAESRLRVLCVNTGILGHRSVARVIREALTGAGVDADHIDLSDGLTVYDRAVRRLLTLGPAPGTVAGALTAARFRHEWNAGLLAARRVEAFERRGRRFDVLHFHTQAAAWGSLRRLRRIPSIVSIDITQRLASLERPQGLHRRDYRLNATRDREVFRAARAIVATSQWAADDLARDLPECAGRLTVLPYPVPLGGFDARWPEERRRRSAPVHLLFMGGDFVRKGGQELLEAWGAGGFASAARLTIVTDSPAAPARLPAGVEQRRGVRPYTPEWFDLWRSADLFVLPTRAEAFGMVFQEAAAAGVPAIGTRIGAIPEIVVDGATGVLVPPRDASALAEAMRSLIDAPEARTRMGVAARARIEAVGSVRRYGERLTAITAAIAAGTV